MPKSTPKLKKLSTALVHTWCTYEIAVIRPAVHCVSHYTYFCSNRENGSPYAVGLFNLATVYLILTPFALVIKDVYDAGRYVITRWRLKSTTPSIPPLLPLSLSSPTLCHSPFLSLGSLSRHLDALYFLFGGPWDLLATAVIFILEFLLTFFIYFCFLV